jgi:hypothetical protein
MNMGIYAYLERSASDQETIIHCLLFIILVQEAVREID